MAAAPAFRSKVFVVNSAGALTVVGSEPAGAQPGDIFLVYATWWSGTTVTVANYPPEFNLVPGSPWLRSYQGNSTYWLRRGASAPSGWTWTFSGANTYNALCIECYSGCDPGGAQNDFPWDVVAGIQTVQIASKVNIGTAPAITTTIPNSTVVQIIDWGIGNAGTAYTAPSGWNLREGGGNTDDTAVADLVQASPATVTPTVFGNAGTGTADFFGLTLALKPPVPKTGILLLGAG